MQEICRFLGIVIYMYYREHTPAHFHAEYGEYTITLEIASGIVQGKFPRRALNAVLEWYELHQDELMQNWNLAMDKKALKNIAVQID